MLIKNFEKNTNLICVTSIDLNIYWKHLACAFIENSLETIFFCFVLSVLSIFSIVRGTKWENVYSAIFCNICCYYYVWKDSIIIFNKLVGNFDFVSHVVYRMLKNVVFSIFWSRRQLFEDHFSREVLHLQRLLSFFVSDSFVSNWIQALNTRCKTIWRKIKLY